MSIKIKQNGAVYTPDYLVQEILDHTGYFGDKILKKHVIDNSCGDGAFLKEIVKRYSEEYLKINNDMFSLDDLKIDLEKYIHGIELDYEESIKCQLNLKKIVQDLGLTSVDFDIVNGNSLEITEFNGKMDFVIGNPPYVRVHNLNESFDYIKKQMFTMSGMTDLFIVFYEIGLKMLNHSGVLGYITPSSIFNSVAGSEFRKFVINNKIITSVVDLKHFQPFENITTYTAILKIDKSNTREIIDYYTFNEKSKKRDFVDHLIYDEIFIEGNFYFGNKTDLKNFKEIIQTDIKEKKIEVKNGFATLMDDVFIKNIFDFESKYIYKILKGSKASWKKVIYPYDLDGKIIDFELFEIEVQNYFNLNKVDLSKRSLDKGSKWYAFGRSQGVNDFWKNKIAVNSLIKTKDDIKIISLKPGEGIYSGLYIVGDTSFELVKKILISDDFVNYVKMIAKYKSGGYYTFSSSDLKKYLIYYNKRSNQI